MGYPAPTQANQNSTGTKYLSPRRSRTVSTLTSTPVGPPGAPPSDQRARVDEAVTRLAVFAEVARRADEADWDALLAWDHVVGEKDRRWEIADPWILFTASALATSRIRLGTAITPVARRRPSQLAREVTTLGSLTGGRMILGAGPDEPVAGEYGSFGDTTDTKVLAERLDEGLHALDLLWSGELVTYRGNQITIDDVVFLPVPVQLPRVPVWGGGVWPNKAPVRRAARWDGAIPVMAGWESGGPPDLSEVQELVTFLRAAGRARPERPS